MDMTSNLVGDASFANVANNMAWAAARARRHTADTNDAVKMRCFAYWQTVRLGSHCGLHATVAKELSWKRLWFAGRKL
jgi:hypothetical protein